MLPTGLYEQIINKALDAELAKTDKLSQTARIDEAEAAKVLAKYVAEIVEKGLDNVKDNGGDLNKQVELVNRIVSTVVKETQEADFEELSVVRSGRSSCWHCWNERTRSVPWMKRRRSFARKPPSPKALFLPVPSMSRRCIRSSRRRSSAATG